MFIYMCIHCLVLHRIPQEITFRSGHCVSRCTMLRVEIIMKGNSYNNNSYYNETL